MPKKKWKVTKLPDAKAKGRYPKGRGFRKRPHVVRDPIQGDDICNRPEDVIWLRAGGS